MAHKFLITKTRRPPRPQKGGTDTKSTATKSPRRLVVSAVSKTPITVTPVGSGKKGLKAIEITPQETTQETPAPVALSGTETARRGPGRPRKGAVQVAKPARKARPRRIDNQRLLEEVAQVRTTMVPLAANRIVEQLESLLKRGQVETFRGRKKVEQLIFTKLEEQALREALSLFQMKVTLQRGGSLRRAAS